MQPPDTPLDLPDLLRRLSAMMTGGRDTERDTEMLALAADEIENLRRRAAATEAERSRFESEIRRLQAEVADSDARIAALTAEVENLRSQTQTIDETIAVVPVEQLRLARAQFDYLAQGFAKSGDMISLTICQIGACAIDKALGADQILAR